MKTDDLIQQLSMNVQPVNRLREPLTRFLIWFLAAFFALCVGVALRGVRYDFFQVVSNPWFLLQTTMIFLAAILASASVFLLSVPGNEKRGIPRWLILIPLAAWLGYLGYRLYGGYSDPGSFSYFLRHGVGCMRDIILIGFIPCTILFFMLHKAAPLRLGWTGALATLSATALAATGVQFTCSIEAPLHLLAWHALPVIAIGFIGISLGNYLLRWN